MSTQITNIEAIVRIEDSSILDPATIFKSLEGNALFSIAFGGLRLNGSASFAAISWAKEKKCLISNFKIKSPIK